jgi:hypothetical protein
MPHTDNVEGSKVVCLHIFTGPGRNVLPTRPTRLHRPIKTKIADQNKHCGNPGPGFEPNIVYLSWKHENIIIYDNSDNYKGCIVVHPEKFQSGLQVGRHDTRNGGRENNKVEGSEREVAGGSALRVPCGCRMIFGL